jgi:hypothetical protein
MVVSPRRFLMRRHQLTTLNLVQVALWCVENAIYLGVILGACKRVNVTTFV